MYVVVGRLRGPAGDALERRHVHVLRGGVAERREHHQPGGPPQTAVAHAKEDRVPRARLAQRLRGREQLDRADDHHIHVEQQRTADHKQRRTGRCTVPDDRSLVRYFF